MVEKARELRGEQQAGPTHWVLTILAPHLYSFYFIVFFESSFWPQL